MMRYHGAMVMAHDDSIFALASAPGRAGIAMLRLSGPGVRETLGAIVGQVPAPRHATRARFLDPVTGEPIDDGIALFFPAPHSYTGEDVAEFHIHGGRAIVAALLEALGRRPHHRLAEPGEFTRRAFENGKLDLTEAEAVADLVEAETSAQRRQALRQLEGALGRLYEDWRARLLRALARVEAEIDFPEEGLPPEIWSGVRREVAALAAEIAAHLADGRRGERLHDGVSVAIIGAPNVGKSSLLNALARRDVAITSAIAGTTRDVIEGRLDLGGYPVLVADTAGLRDSDDAIEVEGVRRARSRAAAADLRLIVLDASRPEGMPDHRRALGPPRVGGEATDAGALVVVNKIDVTSDANLAWADRVAEEIGAGPALRLSVATGVGMAELIERLTAEVAKRIGAPGAPVITRARHRTALTGCGEALARFPLASLPELAVEDLRQAARALGRITGRVDVEDMLDIIFLEFCIGK